MFSIIQRSTNFYNEFYVHLLCGFPIMLDYNEMNCNLVSRFFYMMYSEMQILVICNNYEFDVGMNGSVKFVVT